MSIRGGVLAGLCLFGGYVFQTVGLRYTSASKAAFITGFTTPLVALLGSILYRRAPQLTELLGVGIAFLGMALMTIPGGRFQIGSGDLWVSGCAVAYAFHILLTGRFASQVDIGVFIFTEIATGAVVGAATFWWAEPVRVHWSPLLILALAVTSSLRYRARVLHPDLGAALDQPHAHRPDLRHGAGFCLDYVLSCSWRGAFPARYPGSRTHHRRHSDG